MRIVVVRHGEAVGNKEGRFLGRADPPLTESGVAHATALAERLSGRGIAQAVTSDLRRAHATAMIIADSIEVPVRIDRRLREVDHGAIDGWLADEIARSPYGAERERDKYNFHAPGGESYRDIETRLREAIEGTGSADTVVVTHLGPMRVIMKLFGGLTEAEAAALKIGHSSLLWLLPGSTGLTAQLESEA